MRISNSLAGIVAVCAAMAGSSTAGAVNVESTPPIPVAQSLQAATQLTSGRVLVVGGDSVTGGSTAAFLYDPAANAWGTAADLSTRRVRTTATLLPSGNVLVAGGATAGGVDVTATTEIYDVAGDAWRAAAPMSVARQWHTATRLPSGDVLVVGGSDATGTGLGAERYSPTADAWTPQPSIDGRLAHTATLLPGGDVLVAGGETTQGSAAALASVERYSSAGGWTAAAPMATPRRYHTATALADGRVLVVGGESAAGTPLASVEVFDPAGGTWTPGIALPQTRRRHSASLLPDGRVVVSGGTSDGGAVLDTALVFDPVANTWQPLATLGAPRYDHSSTWLPTGGLLLLGGRSAVGFLDAADVLVVRAAGAVATIASPGIQGNITFSAPLPSGRVLVLADGSATCRVYDPATDTWTATGPMSATRSLPTLTALPSGQVLVAGGSNLATAEIYDETTNLWTPAASMSVVHRAHRAVLLPSGKVLVISGFSNAIPGEVPEVEVYDPAADTWTPAAPLLVPRHYSSATLLPSGKVLVAGGFTDGGVTTHSELYDPELDTWTPTGALALPRNGHMATLLHSGKVLVTGGSDGARNTQVQAELYDPATGLWSPAGTLSIGRENHTATLLSSGRVLVVGGYSSNPSLTFYPETELYDPVGNRWLPGTSVAVPRAQHAGELLADGRVLLAGGVNRTGFITAAEVFDEGVAPDPLRRPLLTSTNGYLLQPSVLTATGSGFLPALDASGGASNASPTNAPVFQIQRVDNGQTRFVPNDALIALDDTTFTGVASAFADFPAGPVHVRTWVNGVPSRARHSTLAVPPGATVDRSATGGALHALLGWSQPYDGGAPVTYDVLASNGATRSCTAPCDPLTFPLPPGDYTFTMTLANPAGAGPGAAFGLVTVVKDAVALTVTPASATPTAFAPVTVDVAVAAATSDTFVPSGAVVVGDGNGTTCTIASLVDGVGACELTFPAAGAATLTANYAGDTNFEIGSSTAAVTVIAPTIDVAPASVPDGQVAQPYSATTFTASGGTAPYAYAIGSGALPAGLSLSPAGVLSGTPGASGVFSIDVEATDANDFVGTVSLSLDIAAATLALAPATLPPAAVGTPYTQAFDTTGGIAPYGYTLASGTLPDGVQLVAGALTGTPGEAGHFPIRVRSTDSSGGTGPASVERDYTLTVATPQIVLTPASLADGRVAVAYPATAFTATGGAEPYVFALAGGALPDGLALSPGGALTGTPSASGTFAFDLLATDADGFSGSVSLTLTIAAPALSLTPATLTPAAVGEAYSLAFTTSGGIAPYTYTVLAGPLPAGLTLTPQGVLAGTPTQGGSFPLRVRSTDSSGGDGPASIERDYVLQVAVAQSAIAVTSSGNPSEPGEAVTFTITVTQGGAATKRQTLPGAIPKVATGNVTISEGPTTLATVALDAAGQATYTTDALSPGAHVLRVNYGGDTNTAAASTQIVQQVGLPGVAPLPQTIPATDGWSLWSLLAAIGVLGLFATRRRV